MMFKEQEKKITNFLVIFFYKNEISTHNLTSAKHNIIM